MAISKNDELMLYSRSAGMCNICKKHLFPSGISIGERAHMVARHIGGPRGNIGSRDCIDSYSNIILLCPTCHTCVDKDVGYFTADLLMKIKAGHERFIFRSTMYLPVEYEMDFLRAYFSYSNFFNCVNDPILFSEGDKIAVKANISLIVDCFFWGLDDFPRVYPFKDERLQYFFSKMISSYERLCELVGGGIYEGSNFVAIPLPEGEIFMVLQDDILPPAYVTRLRENVMLAVECCRSCSYDLIRYIKEQYHDKISLP